MGYFLILSGLLLFALIGAPFYLFPGQMEHYGTYLTGVAAMGAALKFVAPYLLIFFYKKRYSNELIWKSFLQVESPEKEGRVLETEWIGGLINYFRRCSETLSMSNPWYDKLPYLSDDIYMKFGRSHLIGKREDKLFEEIKGLLFNSSEIVAMNSTPDRPMVDENKYKKLCSNFEELKKKFDEMNGLLMDVPIPAKKIIEGNDFYKSFFKS